MVADGVDVVAGGAVEGTIGGVVCAGGEVTSVGCTSTVVGCSVVNGS